MFSTLANPDNYIFKVSNPNVKMYTVPQLVSVGDQVPFYVGGSGQVQQAMKTLGINPYSAREMTLAKRRRK